MKTLVRGFTFGKEDNYRTPVFFRQCKTARGTNEAVEEAWDRGADMIIIERVKMRKVGCGG